MSVPYACLSDLLNSGDLSGQGVLFRADLNIPIKNGCVQDASRLQDHKKSLLALSAHGARIAVLSHFGRPQGAPHKDLSLAPIVGALEDVLDKKVAFAPDCIGPRTRNIMSELQAGEILVLENTRFHKGEEDNDSGFAAELARLGSFYVNDAFSVAHRANASTEALAHIRPAFAGFALCAELEKLTAIFSDPRRPALGIAGGAKVAGKIDILSHLLDRMDCLAIGGAMANAFLTAQNRMPYSSARINDEAINAAQALLEKAAGSSCRILLPQDVVIASALRENIASSVCEVDQVPDGMFCLDVGPKTIADIGREIDQARTILWNGPLGAFETPPFDKATREVAAKIAECTRGGQIISIAGGGETGAAINLSGMSSGFTHISTAGGAFLAWLEGKPLPAIAALSAAR